MACSSGPWASPRRFGSLLVTVMLLCGDRVAARKVKGPAKKKGGGGGAAGWRNEPADFECSAPWDKPEGHALALARCDIDELTEEGFTQDIFDRVYSLKRPFVIRNSRLNGPAREFLADRCAFLAKHGDVSVVVGDPFSLVVHGSADKKVRLREYCETPFTADSPFYFFDKYGKWTDKLGKFSTLLNPPAAVTLRPTGNDAPLIFSIGKTGSGIGLHAHQDAWNQVLIGAKRWTLYKSVPPVAGYNPSESHLSWMEKVYPDVVGNGSVAPLECMQNEGDIMYVPEGWYHATVNVGDTHSIAQRTEDFIEGGSRGIGQKTIKAVMKGDGREALKWAEKALAVAPEEPDHHINKGHALKALKRMDEAAASCARAAELMPRNPGAYLMHGTLLNEMGKFAEAEPVLQTALDFGTVLKASAFNRMVQEIRRQLRMSQDGQREL